MTGSHRSGTTWVGRMLALDPRLVYIHEPFNPEARPPSMRARPPFWFQYVTAENEASFVGPIDEVLRLRYPRRNRQTLTTSLIRLLGGIGPRRSLVKDPIAVMSAEWLASRFCCEMVVLVRHPAAFASSLKRLGWTFDFSHWTRQPLLLRDLAAPYEAEIRSFAERERDIIDQSILLWNVIHHVILGYRERHPDWAFIRHEDLCDAPVQRFRDLFARLELRWTQEVATAVRASSSDESRGEVAVSERNVVVRDSRAARWTWLKRLSAEEQRRIREGTADVASALYTDADWDPANAVGLES